MLYNAFKTTNKMLHVKRSEKKNMVITPNKHAYKTIFYTRRHEALGFFLRRHTSFSFRY